MNSFQKLLGTLARAAWPRERGHRPANEAVQLEVCRRFGAKPFRTPPGLKVGITRNLRDGVWPLHGVRHQPEGGTSGWYIWAGEWSDDPDFFTPLCDVHLTDWCPAVIPYLLLPPGWRFLIAPDYEDVWFDERKPRP